MEKSIKRQRVVIIILVAALIYGFFYLGEIKTEFNNRYNSLSQQYNNLNSQINSIYNNVDEKLKKQASLITNFEFSYGDFDKETLKVPVKVKITPKTASPETALTLDFAGKTVEMKQGENMEYTADFKSDIFFDADETEVVKILIRNGNVTQSEELEWYLDSFHRTFLPSIVSSLIFDDVIITKNGSLSVKGDIMFHWDVVENQPGFKTLKAVYCINGEILEETDISQYLEAETFDRLKIDKTFESVKPGDKFILYLEAEDEFGFIHRNTIKEVDCVEEAASITIHEAVYPEGDVILDKEGNVLSDGWK